MGSTWSATPAVIVSVGCPLTKSLGMLWHQAVATIPSLDSPNMRTWLHGQRHDLGAAVVFPVRDCPDAVRRFAHREVCVPAHEYALFTAALPPSLR